MNPLRNVLLLAALPIVAIVLPGCLTTDSMVSKSHFGSHVEKPPTGVVHQVQAMWENRVVVTQDTVDNGKPLAGLAGRVYFFGDEIGQPLAAKGTLTVDAHEILPDGKTRMMERWEIDPITLQKLGRPGTIGWGYTIFLPWSSYRPDIARVQLQVTFIPEQGVPLFSPPSAVSLLQEGPPVITSNVVPAASFRK